MAVSFGSEITGVLASAETREWLITNGLGSYGCGTVAGSLTRAYHGLLVAALRAPADPCTRTLLVAALEEVVQVGDRSLPLYSQRWADGVVAPAGHPWIVSFALEGRVPTWRYALGDALLEKRLWMQPGAHTTTVLYRLLQASQPVHLSLTALVNARSHHGGTTHPEMVLQALPRGVAIGPRANGVPPFVVLSDRGVTQVASPGQWCWGYALTAEAERGLPSTADHLRASRITVTLTPEAPTLTVVASTEADPPLDGERALATASPGLQTVRNRDRNSPGASHWRLPRLRDGHRCRDGPVSHRYAAVGETPPSRHPPAGLPERQAVGTGC